MFQCLRISLLLFTLFELHLIFQVSSSAKVESTTKKPLTTIKSVVVFTNGKLRIVKEPPTTKLPDNDKFSTHKSGIYVSKPENLLHVTTQIPQTTTITTTEPTPATTTTTTTTTNSPETTTTATTTTTTTKPSETITMTTTTPTTTTKPPETTITTQTTKIITIESIKIDDISTTTSKLPDIIFLRPEPTITTTTAITPTPEILSILTTQQTFTTKKSLEISAKPTHIHRTQDKKRGIKSSEIMTTTKFTTKIPQKLTTLSTLIRIVTFKTSPRTFKPKPQNPQTNKLLKDTIEFKPLKYINVSSNSRKPQTLANKAVPQSNGRSMETKKITQASKATTKVKTITTTTVPSSTKVTLSTTETTTIATTTTATTTEMTTTKITTITTITTDKPHIMEHCGVKQCDKTIGEACLVLDWECLVDGYCPSAINATECVNTLNCLQISCGRGLTCMYIRTECDKRAHFNCFDRAACIDLRKSDICDSSPCEHKLGFLCEVKKLPCKTEPCPTKETCVSMDTIRNY